MNPKGPRSILVTGADGFVGRHLCPALLRHFPNASLTAYLRDSNKPFAEGRVCHGDVTDAASLEQAFHEARPEIVVHLAAQSSVGQSAADRQATWQVNVEGTKFVATSAASIGSVECFLFVSSGEVYGRSLTAGPANETTPLDPINNYAESKVKAEAAAAHALAGSRARLVVCRPFNHCGPGQHERFVVARLAAQVARIERGVQSPIVTAGDLSIRRDFLDVRDVAEAYAALIERAAELPEFAVFNIASGHGRELVEILSILRAASSARFDVSTDPAMLRPAEIANAVGDAGALRALTGWRPRRTFEETVRDTLGFFRDRTAQLGAG